MRRRRRIGRNDEEHAHREAGVHDGTDSHQLGSGSADGRPPRRVPGLHGRWIDRVPAVPDVLQPLHPCRDEPVRLVLRKGVASAVAWLEEPFVGIEPAPLAPLNWLEQYRQPALNSTLFTVVGYGTEVRKSPTGPQKPTPQPYPLVRRYTETVGQKLTSQILQVNGNEHDTRGAGGSCFGDSGGPTFDPEGYLVTVTSYGYTSNCRYIDGLQRVDIEVVQNWLAGFEVYPAA